MGQTTSSHPENTVSRPRLNEDVLYHIMWSLARPRDVLAAMQTCYALYTLGMPILLHDVRLRSAGQFALLEDFLEHHPIRYESIRTIQFSFCSGFDQLAERLVGFLQKLSRLQDLSFTWLPITHDDGRLLDRISEQVASMRHLRALSLLGDIPPRHVAHLFSHVKAPLSSLDIGYFYYNIHPLTLLVPLKSHLENLTIRAHPGGVSFSELEDLGSEVLKFPRVRSLSFDCRGADFPKLGLLPRIFPNVRHFTVRGAHLPTDQAALNAIRDANRAQQDKARWTTLERLEGTVRSVYAAGLTSRVEHLRLNLASRVNESVAHCAKTVIGDAKPRSLQVDVQADTVRVLRDLPDMLEEVYQSLDKLHICLYLDSDGVVSATNDNITHELLSSIAKFTSLKGLHLALLETRQLVDKENGFYVPQWITDRFKLIDMDRLSRIALECLPTLREVRVEVLDRFAVSTRAVSSR